MSETFNRSYLQAMPEKRKHRIIESIFNNTHRQAILETARIGNTSYLFDTEIHKNSEVAHLRTSSRREIFESAVAEKKAAAVAAAEITTADFMNFLQEKFSDCKITYEEQWVETSSNMNQKTSIFKKGIMIDWS